MTSARLLPAFALLLLLPPLAGAHGPYEGTATQGSVDRYVDDHLSPFCLQVITRWTVTLTYAPASDVLTLSVAGWGADVGRNGAASVSFTTSSSCAYLDILVQGTLVADEADYSVVVTTGPG